MTRSMKSWTADSASRIREVSHGGWVWGSMRKYSYRLSGVSKAGPAGAASRFVPAGRAARVPALSVTVVPATAVTIVPGAMPTPWTSMPTVTPVTAAQVMLVAPAAAAALSGDGDGRLRVAVAELAAGCRRRARRAAGCGRRR